MSRSKNKRSNKRRAQKAKTNAFFIMVGALLIIFAALTILGSGGNSAAQAAGFSAEDIVVDPQPLVVGHEMDGSTSDQIAFFPKGQPQPQIAVTEIEFDFGRIGAADVVTHEFFIQNLGEAPLVISRAYTTCGCTTATFSATVIPPGKVVSMILTLDAGYHDARGQRVERGVIIENNDPAMPELALWVQATVANP
jgi:hypothetical protein